MSLESAPRIYVPSIYPCDRCSVITEHPFAKFISDGKQKYLCKRECYRKAVNDMARSVFVKIEYDIPKKLHRYPVKEDLRLSDSSSDTTIEGKFYTKINTEVKR